jgi:predicted lipid-binding transport protein (Tim44 family)
MKTWIMIALTVMVGIGLAPIDAEAAKRLGGGGSTGMQRQSIAPKPAAPAQSAAKPAAPAAAPAAPAPAPAGNRWLGPIAGLAAGLGLGYLFSQGGFGGMGGILSTLLIGVLVFGGVMLLMRMFMKPRAQVQPAGGPNSYGMLGQETVAAPPPSQMTGMTGGAGGPDFRSQFQPNIPAGFDAAGFVKQAKLSFMNLQKANDTGDLETLRDMSTDEMFALFKSQIDSRFGVKQRTEVVTLAADLLEVVTENAMHVASVRFAGMIKDDGEAVAAPFEEVWNLQKPVSGGAGWMLAGIQQVATA